MRKEKRRKNNRKMAKGNTRVIEKKTKRKQRKKKHRGRKTKTKTEGNGRQHAYRTSYLQLATSDGYKVAGTHAEQESTRMWFLYDSKEQRGRRTSLETRRRAGRTGISKRKKRIIKGLGTRKKTKTSTTKYSRCVSY